MKILKANRYDIKSEYSDKENQEILKLNQDIDDLLLTISREEIQASNFISLGVPLIIFSSLFFGFFVDLILTKSENTFYVPFLQYFSLVIKYLPPALFLSSFIFIIFIIVFLHLFHFKYFKIIRMSKNSLALKEQELRSRLMRDRKSRYNLLSADFNQLGMYLSSVIFEDKFKNKKANDLRKQAGYVIQQGSEFSDLNELQYIINTLEELVYREKIEQKNQRRWQAANIFVISLYISLLACLMIFISIRNIDLTNVSLPIIQIPIWVVVWGALGSISAILYRFYTENSSVKFSAEFRWLVARPIIGIFMSALAYLAVQTGLIVLGAPPVAENDATNNAERIAAILCFLAGFSDRVYLGIIDLLVNKFPLDQESDPVVPEDVEPLGNPHLKTAAPIAAKPASKAIEPKTAAPIAAKPASKAIETKTNPSEVVSQILENSD